MALLSSHVTLVDVVAPNSPPKILAINDKAVAKNTDHATKLADLIDCSALARASDEANKD